jgi:membrane associated rhomboid family serine protease
LKKNPLWKIIRWPILFVAILWFIELISVLTGTRAFFLGVIPRTISGIPGIFFSPFIHENYDHLLSNSLPLLVVGSGLIYFYREIAWHVLIMIWLFTGFWVWLAAREEAHIGASGLIYGLVCFLFFSGLIRKDTRLMAVSFLVTFLYGSMVWGILPIDQTVSWESHLFGSVAGIFCAVYYRKLGPQRPKAQWEIDEENELAAENELFTNEENKDNASTSQPIVINYEYTERDDKSDANPDDPQKKNL